MVTRAPPSRHTRSAALSTANPRLSRTPDLAQAARWWPQESSGKPHWVKERGRRKRRKSKVWKKSGSMRVKAQVRLVENAAPTPQLPCDLSIAFSLSDMTESNSSRNWRSTLDENLCCHPNLEHPWVHEEEAWPQPPTPPR